MLGGFAQLEKLAWVYLR